VLLDAQSPKPPKIHIDWTHTISTSVLTILRLMSHFWWLWLLVAALGAIRGLVWLAEQRRIARSGITQIDAMDGHTFERRMELLFRDLGYRVERTRTHGDYGADLVVEKNGERSVIQAKRWNKRVGVKAVQEAVAAKPMYRCEKACVVTNSYFTDQAKTLARANAVELWDRDRLMAALLAAQPQQMPTEALA
jgi:restriction system protein